MKRLAAVLSTSALAVTAGLTASSPASFATALTGAAAVDLPYRIASSLYKLVPAQPTATLDYRFSVQQQPGVRYTIEGDPVKIGLLTADDSIVITATADDQSPRVLEHDFTGGCKSPIAASSIDITSLLRPGENQVVVKVVDSCGLGAIAHSDMWLVGGGPVATTGTECNNGRVGSGDWAYSGYVSAKHGLILNMARLGVRQMISTVSVPYFKYEIASGGGYQTHRYKGRLTAENKYQHGTSVVRTSLVDFRCDPARFSAKYRVDGLPTGLSLHITQDYRFLEMGGLCEPSLTLNCANFWPTISWESIDTDREDGVGLQNVSLVQRLKIAPDGISDSPETEIVRDSPNLSTHPHVELQVASREVSSPVVVNGANTGDTFDNFHVNGLTEVELPGNLGTPGCPQCLHAHWRWSSSARAINFSDGKPALLPGSPQTTYLHLVRDGAELTRAGEWDPYSSEVAALVNGEKVKKQPSILYWESKSSGIRSSDKPGVLYDAIWPFLPGRRVGDRGYMWASAAETWDNYPDAWGQSLSLQPIWAELKNLNGKWILPGELSHVAYKSEPTAKCLNVHGGPFYISVDRARTSLTNAEWAYKEWPHGKPYVQLRTDSLKNGRIVLGDVVEEVKACKPVRFLLEFQDRPSAELRLEVLARPGGWGYRFNR